MSSPARRRQRLDFLDVARGGAALLVLVEHGLHHCIPGYLEFSKSHIVVGQAGILVFFMVSGFLIPKSLEEGKSNASFWLRRFFRLFPVYWFSIALGLAYLLAGGPLPLNVRLSDAPAWAANAALLQGWLNRPNVWDVYWSLHYEVGFYVLSSALFAFGLLHRVGLRAAVALLVCFTLTFSLGYRLSGRTPGAGDLRLLLLAVLFGLVCYRHASGRLSRGALFGLLGGMFAAALVVWGANHFWYPAAATAGQLARHAALMALGFGGFTFLLTREGGAPRAACWLGRRCYPLYLVHPFVLVLLAPANLPAWAFMPALVAGSLLLAEVTHRLVERPGIAAGRWVEKRFAARSTAPASAVIRVAESGGARKAA